MKRPALTSLLIALLLCAASAFGADRALTRWMFKEPRITQITIQGNEHFSDDAIRGRLYSKKANFWLSLKQERRIKVQRETPRRDSLEVSYMYLTEGYLDIQVHTEYVPRGADSTAEVRISIVEGSRYRLGDASVKGDFPAQFATDLQKIAHHLEKGKPADPFKIRQAEFDIKTVMANKGYPYATVVHNLDSVTQEGLSPIVFNVTADSIVHYGTVKISGLMDYPEKVARRELKIHPGALYKREDIIQSQQRLYESGYFSTLMLSMDPASPDSLKPDFILRLRERKPMYATLQTGAAQSQVRDLLWDFSARFGKRNFLGSRLVELSPSYEFAIAKDSRLLSHRYQVRYVEPWTLGIRMPLELIGEVRPEVRSATQDYKISSWSISASTTRKFGQISAARFGIEYQSVTVTGVPPDLEQLRKQEEGISGRRKLTFDFRRDSRQNVFIPSQGSLFDYSAQYFGGFLGGDEDFAKMESSISRYLVVWPGWISASRVKGGWADDFGAGTDVPLEDRFYLGGANSIRGFKENSLGPLTADGTPEGSHVYLLFNQEFRWKTIQVLQAIPLAGSLFRQFPLWQSVFFDVGNGFNKWSEMKFAALAYSYGTGAQIVTPAGPIRIDYARRIDSPRYEPGSRWHFTILYAF